MAEVFMVDDRDRLLAVFDALDVLAEDHALMGHSRGVWTDIGSTSVGTGLSMRSPRNGDG
ncbi:hypothetical protein [Tenggerimyces flavus]|uniref:Uncharacterized protein n=1 Tax=Tenggerimyces flavus TaxID=1708749 RepID=A0ABV7YAN1_9ACTN|nr:hypothetical protein [Tenggerimyces flavus]MBM7790283.1 hypothetical protein [Tenggerimyces flavus]